VVLQESGVTLAFVRQALPLLERAGIDLDVYYVASAEFFDLLSPAAQEAAFPAAAAERAMGITGFTLPTMYRWIRSARGREFTLHPFQHGHFLASGRGEAVMEEAGPRRREPVRGDPAVPGLNDRRRFAAAAGAAASGRAARITTDCQRSPVGVS